MNKIFTIGHSTRSLKEFVEILHAYGIEQVVDVRSIPKSLHNPQYNQTRLRNYLSGKGIRYKHMKGLGGLRHAKKDSENQAWENASFRGFADYMQTAAFQKSLQTLINLLKKRRVVLMCAEAVPWRCHRSLIGDALLVHKIKVEDILSPTNSRSHSMTPWAKVDKKRVHYPLASTS